jgi:anti-anti-sigma factor
VKIVCRDGTLKVSQIEQLANANREWFRSQLVAALPSEVNRVEIDLSETRFLDCGGVGALIALRKYALARRAEAAFQILNPSWQVRQIFNLVGLGNLLAPTGA